MGDEQKDGRESFKRNLAGTEKYIQLGIMLPGAVFIGWLIGSLLDRWLGTHWIYIAGLFVGIAAGFVQLIRIAISASDAK